MNRSVSSHRKPGTFILAILSALCAVVFLFAGCAPANVPVTGEQQPVGAVAGDQAAKADQPEIAAAESNAVIGAQPDNAAPSMPKAGAQPESAADSKSVVSAPKANPNPSKVYYLVTNGKGISVAPPDTTVLPGSVTYYVGAGYRLVITASGGWLLPPAPVPATKQRVDLESGYALEITAGQGQVILPSNNRAILPLPHDPLMQVEHIGGGYYLVSYFDEAWILQGDPTVMP
ncbi:MAG: hypothetical protein EHM21_02910 [Chloroflexi bacterium]|nr:MAG: hypothetical protein EHM21_02910 [Chloroflexota bacterium]